MNGLIFTGIPYELTGHRVSGAYRLATYLREHNYSVEVIDFFDRWSDSDLKLLIQSRNASNPITWIGFSYTWLSSIPDRVRQVSDAIKAFYPEIKIIIGGNFKTIANIHSADYFINGYAERVMVELLGYFEGKNKKPFGRPVLDKAWHIDAFHFYPCYDLDNYDIKFVENDFLTEHSTTATEFARGCRFKCKFCEFPILGLKEDVSLSEEAIYQSLQSNYDKWGITNYTVADETINDREEKLIKIRNAVKRLNFTPSFFGFIRADLIHSHPHWIELIAECRIIGQYYGLETLNHESGKIIGKGLDPELNKDIVLRIKEYFKSNNIPYRGSISLIAGLPRESFKSLENTIKWIDTYWYDQATTMFPLHISKSSNLRLNAFGEDFSNFGYEIMSPEEIEIAESENNVDHMFADWGDGIPTIYWKNEYGTYFDFKEWTRTKSTASVLRKRNAFGIIDLLSLGYNMDQSLERSAEWTMEDKYRSEKIFQRYVMKKLSYKEKKS